MWRGGSVAIGGELFAKFQTGFCSDPTDAVFKALGHRTEVPVGASTPLFRLRGQRDGLTSPATKKPLPNDYFGNLSLIPLTKPIIIIIIPVVGPAFDVAVGCHLADFDTAFAVLS